MEDIRDMSLKGMWNAGILKESVRTTGAIGSVSWQAIAGKGFIASFVPAPAMRQQNHVVWKSENHCTGVR
jgi:hypothetical protein